MPVPCPPLSRSALLALATLAAALPAAAQDGVGLERAFPRLRFQRPVFLTGAGDGSGRLFVVEQDGVVHMFRPDEAEEVATTEVFLDLRERISRRGNEEGLLGLAFDPEFATTGELYVHYSSSVNDKVGTVSRFRVRADDPDRADPDSEEVVLEQPQPYRNHNGGTIAFGSDGMLYVSFGDGGDADDPHGHGQDTSTWLGAILRVDVRAADGPGYAVPPDNPFVGDDAGRDELWAYGLRNVWRFSFDRQTGDLWAADIGQDRIEEVDLVVRGGNYGWNAYEASQVFDEDVELTGGVHAAPVAEYGRAEGISITGGYVYRGARHPSLRGRYFYGDYESGNLWSLRPAEGGGYATELVRRTGKSIASFGEDDDGELFLCSFDGGLYRLVPSDEPVDFFSSWPTTLSETGLFASTEDQVPAAHVVPYEVNAPFWSDGAEKDRWLALPEGAALGLRADGAWDVPVGATLVKTFRMPRSREDQRLETRLIERTEDGWEAATYLWDWDGEDAVLAPEGRQFELWSRETGVSTWHAPSTSECASCHVADAGFVLGLTTAQLNRTLPSGEEQIATWIERGLVRAPDDFDPARAPRLASPLDDAVDLELRARTWLDVNCAMCHFPDGPGNASIDLRLATPLTDTGLVDGEVAQGALGVADARIVAPGDPDRSILWHRVHTKGSGRMPNVGSNRVDEEGAALLRAWIDSLAADGAGEER